MDSMMFSPYGYGPLPPSAMAEIEKKTAAALQSSSLRKLLELDKEQKAEPLQSAPTSPPSSPPPDGFRPDRSIQVRRADSISKQQNSLMLKAASRSVIPPSLSIAIPPSPSGEQRQRPRDKQVETEAARGSERGGDQEARADVEPLHKQVKFLAPDEDGEMSDQSSICQSPSWEGYGQRKKEKKKEAERRKKEKEQAEKEAKAAKKRQATRLSKSPPPAVNGRASRAGILSDADRSLSDPMLISQHLLPEIRPTGGLDDIGRAASADDLQRFRDQQPAMAEVLSDFDPHGQRFTGGVKLERERQSTLQNHLAARGPQSPSSPGHLAGNDGVYQSNPNSPPLDGSMALASYSTSQPAKQETRPSREAFPPSASRTPMLRHMPPPVPNRNNSFLQGASKIFRGRDGRASAESESDRGRHRDGYVQRHREQSVERSVAEIAYEQLINNGSYHSSSTRSSSRDTRHTRRSSFTQEARSVAMKLAGMKLTPSARDESAPDSGRASSQTDYFNHPTDHSHSTTAPAVLAPVENGTASATNQETYRNYLAQEQLAASEAALAVGGLALRDGGAEQPLTSQSSASSGPIGGTASRDPAKKGRSFRDVAKAALGPSRGPHAVPDGPPSQMLAVPYATLRSHVDSSDPAPEAIPAPLRSPKSTSPTATALQERNPQAIQSVSNQLESSVVKPTDIDHVGSRVSEGSSSSSAYEDGSPPPSPVTTPDTSRPQSSKDVPYAAAELSKNTEGSRHSQDDDATVHQPSEGSNASSTSTTPRQVNSEAIESADLPNEDRFSRTALPLELPPDIDCDAQSFTTSFSNLDGIDNIDATLANAAAAAQQSRQKGGEDDQPVQQPKRLRSLSDTNHRSGNLDSAMLPASFTQFDVGSPAEMHISIPPRSKKREAAGRPSTSHGETAAAERRQEHASVNQHQQPEPGWGSVKTGKGSVRETADFGKSAEWATLSNTETADSVESGRAAPIKETSFLISRDSTPEMSPTYAPQDREQIDSHRPTKTQYVETRSSGRTSTSPTSPQSPKFQRPSSPAVKHAHRSPAPPRMASAPTPVSRPTSAASSSRSTTSTTPALGPSPTGSVTRPAGATPVSILKQPTRSTSDSAAVPSSASSRPPVLSALPKHMQLQAGISSRAPVAAPEARVAPIAKMFVECCNCKFYHDMPSKLYECMAKPDAVVEDKLLGISGAITTMVKCPWCQHNMSTNCCAGYAAVVYLKEKLH